VAAVFFSIGLFFPVHGLSAASDTCTCYAGQAVYYTATASKASTCSIACSATSKDVTAYSYGDSAEKKPLVPATDANGGKRCLCSADTISAASVAAAVISPSLFLVHNTVEGGYVFDEAGCDQSCADKGYKSYALGTYSLLRNVTKTPSSSAATPSAGGPQITSDIIPGTTEPGGLIQCGRPGQRMCTLCDLIKGMNIIIHYLMRIAVGVALLAVAIGGVMYVVSAGDSGLIETAKSTMKNAAWGFVLIFAGFLIINTTIDYIGAKKDVNGNLTFGMNITSWGQFDCNAGAR